MWTCLAFWRSRRGATSVEYALIAGVVSLAIVLGATTIGTKLNAHYFTPVASGLS